MFLCLKKCSTLLELLRNGEVFLWHMWEIHSVFIGTSWNINKYVSKSVSPPAWGFDCADHSHEPLWQSDVFSPHIAHERKHCGCNLLWTLQGVTVSRACQTLVTAGWLESMKNALSGDGKRMTTEDGRRWGGLTHLSLLHQLLSVVRTIGFRPQSAPFFTSCGDGCIIQCDRPCRREIKIFAKSNVDSSSLRTLEVAEFNDAAEKHSKGRGDSIKW